MNRNSLLTAAALVLVFASPAWAAGLISVTNISTSSALFLDDGFEDDTAGATGTPDAPSLGTWSSTGSTISILNDVSPGASDGNNYLHIVRGTFPRLFENFSAPVPSGETMFASFAFQYQSTGSSSVAFKLRAGTTILGYIYSEADYSTPNFFTLDGSAGNQMNSSLAVTPGAWQKIGITYTSGSSDVTLTVDGVSQTFTGAFTPGNVDNIWFDTGAGGTAYYLDAVSAVPEPSTFALAGLGLAGLLIFRRRV